MADWDSLISLKTKENEVEKPEVKELETVKNKDFIFGDVLENAKQQRLDDAIQNAILNPLKIKPVEKKEKVETAGSNWYNIPKAKLSEEDKRDWDLLRMRSVLTKGGVNAVELPEKPPEFLQFGVVQDNPIEGNRGRVAKRLRAPTIAESLAKDEQFHDFMEKNYEKLEKKKRN